MKKLKFPVVLLLVLLSFFTVCNAAETDINSARNEKTDLVAGHSIFVAGGISHIATEVDMDYLHSGEPRIGGNVQVGYEWISSKKIGVGFLYDGYFTGFTMCVPVSGGYSAAFPKGRWGLHYFAPQFVGRITLRSDKWMLNYGVGAGLFMSYECLKYEGKPLAKNYDYGIGLNGSFGVEFRLSKAIGLTAGLTLLEGYVDQEYYGETLSSSMLRVNLDLGLKCHF